MGAHVPRWRPILARLVWSRSIRTVSTGVLAKQLQGLIPRKLAQGAVHPGASDSKTGARKTAYRVVA